MSNPLDHFPVVITIPVAWGEMDSFQHVNNVVYFRYFESARIAYFSRLNYAEILDDLGVGPILASISCRFKFPLTYPDTVWSGCRVTHIGDDRFTVHHVVYSQTHSRIAAEGDGVIVAYDYRALKKAALPDEMRRRIEALEGQR